MSDFNFKRFKNRTRQKITMQVMNRPWRSFWVTLTGGALVGGAAVYIFLTILAR